MKHLSEEAIDDALIGLASAETEAHLATCDECREKVGVFQSNMQLFNDATMAWSEAKVSSHRIAINAGVKPRRPAVFAQWTWVMATALLVAAASPLVYWKVTHHNGINTAANTTPAVAPADAVADTATQIAEDNQLLQSVNAALTKEDASPAQEFGLKNVSSSSSSHHHS